jgi:uncharacterized membrane protein
MSVLRKSLVAQSLFYIAAGVNHFWHKPFYVHIMPDHYAHPELLVEVSGLAEIAAGVGLLVPATRRASAIGIVSMLAVYMDVHQYMLRHADRFPEVPKWALWARIPLQFALAAWALEYARRADQPTLTSGADEK